MAVTIPELHTLKNWVTKECWTITEMRKILTDWYGKATPKKPALEGAALIAKVNKVLSVQWTKKVEENA